MERGSFLKATKSQKVRRSIWFLQRRKPNITASFQLSILESPIISSSAISFLLTNTTRYLNIWRNIFLQYRPISDRSSVNSFTYSTHLTSSTPKSQICFSCFHDLLVVSCHTIVMDRLLLEHSSFLSYLVWSSKMSSISTLGTYTAAISSTPIMCLFERPISRVWWIKRFHWWVGLSS